MGGAKNYSCYKRTYFSYQNILFIIFVIYYNCEDYCFNYIPFTVILITICTYCINPNPYFTDRFPPLTVNIKEHGTVITTLKKSFLILRKHISLLY